jgi:hypothetical protein
VTCYGLGVFCADFDGDGWPDVFVASDQRPNRLFLNRHDGTFKEDALLRGLAYNSMGNTQANMGVAVGDVDGDDLFDVFVTHLTSETNTLWVQKPRGWFRDGTTAAGLTAPAWPGTGWGTVLADFDHDGDANGLHQAKALPSGTGEPVVFLGSTTGPSFTQEKCSALQVTWSVRPACAKVDIGSVNKWCDGNLFNEDHAHGVRQLVTARDLLAPIE